MSEETKKGGKRLGWKEYDEWIKRIQTTLAVILGISTILGAVGLFVFHHFSLVGPILVCGYSLALVKMTGHAVDRSHLLTDTGVKSVLFANVFVVAIEAVCLIACGYYIVQICTSPDQMRSSTISAIGWCLQFCIVRFASRISLIMFQTKISEDDARNVSKKEVIELMKIMTDGYRGAAEIKVTGVDTECKPQITQESPQT